MSLDETRLGEFIDAFVDDLGAALHASTIVVGDKLGLYRALAELGPTDAATLAARTGLNERLVQEWLDAQYVSGYCQHSSQTASYWLTPEQSAVLADPASPVFMVGAMTLAASTAKDEDKIREAFRTGKGLGWHEHHHDLFHGTERLFKPGYAANLVSDWLPALDDVPQVLTAGGSVADLGCGHGASTILLSGAFPNSTVTGFDIHQASIDIARKRAAEAGVADRVRFEVASAQDFPGTQYDLVCTFDALHDMGDPVGAARHIRKALSPAGTWLIVEPMAGDRLEDNVNPVGRIFYSASTLIGTPGAQSQPGGYALGAQASDARWAAVAADAGFRRFRRATETPLNRIFEARPEGRDHNNNNNINNTRSTVMAALEINDFTAPDEVRRPDPHATVEVVNVAGGEIGRYTFQPGWRWSEHIKPVVGGDSCQTNHIGYLVSGKMGISTADGSTGEVTPGCVYHIAPGHDGWVIGDEPVVVVEFQGAATYAKA